MPPGTQNYFKEEIQVRAKEYLEQISKFQRNISRRKKEIEEIASLKEEMTEECYKEMLISLEHKVQKEIVEYAETKHRIINEIFELPNSKYVDILFERYVKMKSLVEIAAAENYTYEYIKILHGRALSDFNDNILKKRDKKVQKLPVQLNKKT